MWHHVNIQWQIPCTVQSSHTLLPVNSSVGIQYQTLANTLYMHIEKWTNYHQYSCYQFCSFVRLRPKMQISSFPNMSLFFYISRYYIELASLTVHILLIRIPQKLFMWSIKLLTDTEWNCKWKHLIDPYLYKEKKILIDNHLILMFIMLIDH